NIGEALARIPGLSFQRDNNSGDGEFISIRGLDAQYNTVLYDGLPTGTSDSFRRTALDVVTGSGVSSIQVVKAPLPEHASEGIGGVVDIRSRGALQRSDGLRLRAEATENSFADDIGYEFSGSYTKEINDKVGIYLNGRYRKRYIDAFQINPATTVPDLLQDVTLTASDGSSLIFGDPDTPGSSGDVGDLELVPTGFVPITNFNSEQINYTSDEIERDEITLSGNIEWEIAPHTTLLFGGRHDEQVDDQDTNTIEFDVDNDFVDGVNRFRDPELNFRAAVEDEEQIESRLFLRSETELDNWSINAAAGWSRAFRDGPIREINFIQELEDVPSSPGTGAADERAITFAPFDLSIGDGLFPGPVPLNSAVFLEALDPFCADEDGDSCGEIDDLNYELEDSRENIRYTARFDITRDFSDLGGALQNIKFGAQWETSEFEDRDIDISFVDDTFGPNGEFLGTDRTNDLGDSDVAITDIEGLITDQVVSFDPIGSPFAASGFNGIPRFNPSVLRNVFRDYQAGFSAANVDPRQSDIIEAEEEFLTAYAQAKFTFDKLDIIGGVRVEQYEADFEGSLLFDAGVDFDEVASGTDENSIGLTAPQVARVQTSADNFEVLPRIAATYNVNDQMKVRASYTTAISRPTFDLLTGRIEGDFDIEVTDGVDIATATIDDIVEAGASFEIGNPDLKNAYSQNFDISLEYYANNQNAFSIALFYKEIDDFIFSSFASDATINQGAIDDPGALFAGLNFEGLSGFDL
ncbi:MAG: TonB-dependent receptor, partial [Pseudomonadota bacterium]